MQSIKDIALSIFFTGFCICLAIVPIVNKIDTKVTVFFAIIAAIMIIITGVEIHEYAITHKRKGNKRG